MSSITAPEARASHQREPGVYPFVLMTLEEKARLVIDAMLIAGGWAVQTKEKIHLSAGRTVVLEYFDALPIGLTATPSKQTFAYFPHNLLMEYIRAEAAVGGVKVGSVIYRIKTGDQAWRRESGSGPVHGPARRQTRTIRRKELAYDLADLDRARTGTVEFRPAQR
jgi:type I site-specific restriction endonuclease